MKTEDLRLMLQLVESMELVEKELEKAIRENNTERIKKSKLEILKFQKEIRRFLT